MARYYRLGQARYMDNPLDGVGASKAGGRWNSKSVKMVYNSDSRALACLEVLVHVMQDTVPEYVLAVVDIPDKLIMESTFVAGGSESERAHGDKWVAAANSVGLLVPSAVIPKEMNLLINPEHPDFKNIRVTIEPFSFEKRLLRRISE